MQENRVIEPNFIVNEEGRVFCSKHTLFNKPREQPQQSLPPILNLFATPQPPPLTCITCGHYFNDSCYFAPESVDLILSQRDRGQIICDFCGDRISRSMSVLQKIYYENKFGVKMPLVCCECYASLKTNDFVKQAQKNIVWGILISVAALIACFISLLVPLGGGAAVVFVLFIWGYLTYNHMRKIYYTWRGKKRYQQLEAKLKQ